MALSTTVRLAIAATLSEALDLGTRSFPAAKNFAMDLTSGTGASQADKLFADTRTLAASASEDLDLAGSLVDAFGATITFVKVKGIFVTAAAANTNNVIIGGASATQFVGPFGSATHTIAVAPGGGFMICRPDATGWAVGAGSTDLLKIANSSSGTSVTYDIVIIGTSA
jgi:hypothetical protein